MSMIENNGVVALPSATRIGQGTAVEQSRAAAEVQAAVVVAQQCPRSIPAAIAQMRESCRQKALAERAFYRYNRGGQAVTGPTVHLARELARVWGNMQYGITELRRDDVYGQSEMQAFAWDVQTNTRNVSTFIVPHRRDTSDGAKVLTDARDVYENNTNNANRRVREAILATLPSWFVEEAKDLCFAALKNGGGKPLAKRIADAIAHFENLGVSADQLEQKLGSAAAKWNEHDVTTLSVITKSLQRGEITLEEEFPPRRVTVGELTGAASAEPDDGRPGMPDDAPHYGHAEGEYDPDCAACVAESREADQRAAAQ